MAPNLLTSEILNPAMTHYLWNTTRVNPWFTSILYVICYLFEFLLMILMFYTRDKFIKHLELDMSEEFKLFLEFCIIHIFKIN